MFNYTHKPLPVFAMQFTGSNAKELRELLDSAGGHYKFTGYSLRTRSMKQGIHEYTMSRGNYIIRDHNGNISVMGEKDFEEMYDPA